MALRGQIKLIVIDVQLVSLRARLEATEKLVTIAHELGEPKLDMIVEASLLLSQVTALEATRADVVQDMEN